MSEIDFVPLLKWSRKNFNHLPWRVNRSLYGTLVSEIMLQQTTVGTVINHFESFLKRYPDIKSLSKSTEEEILVAWKGLGYYRRAKNLRRAAIEIHEKFNGMIPVEYENLVLINGIGEYTASAILSIGENRKALSIDANILRVLARIYNVSADKKLLTKLFLVGEILPDLKNGNARDYNEALMDLGREICKAHVALCVSCPVNKGCLTFKNGIEIKKSAPKIKNKIKLSLLRVIIQKGDRLLCYKKGKGEWLEGQWELPTFVLECSEKDFNQYPKISGFEYNGLLKFKSSITKYDITNYVVELKRLPQQIKETKLISLSSESNLSTASIKALRLK